MVPVRNDPQPKLGVRSASYQHLFEQRTESRHRLLRRDTPSDNRCIYRQNAMKADLQVGAMPFGWNDPPRLQVLHRDVAVLREGVPFNGLEFSPSQWKVERPVKRRHPIGTGDNEGKPPPLPGGAIETGFDQPIAICLEWRAAGNA